MNIKFLTGDINNLPENKISGSVYFATQDLNSDLAKGQIFFDVPIGNDTIKRIQMGAAHEAPAWLELTGKPDLLHASSNLSISGTTITFNRIDDNGSAITTKNTITLPNASASAAGVITAGAQTLTGAKTLDANGSLTINKANGLNYAGIASDEGDAARPVWFGQTDANGTPVYNNNFNYNPKTGVLSVLKVNGNAATATTLETARTINGTSFNGSANITTANWGTARNIYISDSDGNYSGAAVSVNGSQNVTLKLPATICRNGIGSKWNEISQNGKPLLKMNTASGFNAFWSLKTTNGWWSMAHNTETGFANHLLFGFLNDANVAGTEGADNHWDYRVRLLPTISSPTSVERVFVTAPYASSKATVGSVTQPIYIDDTGVATPTTYSLNASLNSGTINHLALYSNDNTVAAAPNIIFTHKADATVNSITNINQDILRIFGQTYGNDATTLLSQKAGVMSYGDGGPQIQFGTTTTGGQNGALIFTDHDASGIGVSWHFVSDQSGNALVSSPSLLAKQYLTIGQDVEQRTYRLFVKDNSKFDGYLLFAGKSQGIKFIDPANTEFYGISQNSDNLWIGSQEGTAYQHKGRLILSAGYSGALGTDAASQPSVQIAYPVFNASTHQLTGCTFESVVTGDSIGSATIPVYIGANGKPTAITSYSGNAATATTLQTTRAINGTNFNGSADITTANWGTARNISVADSDKTNTGTAVSVNGSAAVTLTLPATIKASLTGNASTATKLATARTISLTGSVTGSGSFDGSGNLSIATTTNHTHSYLPLSGGSMTGNIIPATTGTCSIGTSANKWDTMYANKVYGGVWNDFAEYRISTDKNIKAGQCVIENGDDTVSLSTARLQPASIVSDTFGFAIGETNQAKLPLAMAGRVLAYPYENRKQFKPGMPVCSGPNGTVSIMTEEEIWYHPHCIIGIVSSVPSYDTWENDIKVDGRIWIKVK